MTTPVLLAHRSNRGGAVVITAEGEADTVTAPVLRRELTAALEEIGEAGTVLVLDATGVTFIDSTGLAELIRANQQCETKQIPLRLVTSPELYRILELTGLIEIFAIADSVDAAVEPDGMS
ncbi:STAS domain-containing protein [Labedaea rhizosphaerae]|uniref:Anti-sigma factor antagonist n=1 Tax=Labedaea rhizosphaerae TaxID=598644 RepID=A0A4R6SG20_LABRH|nr:STAS domain-containing protein [Labedaea rhizosphaerae]TDQ00972.1 anti-anti-sigma factor [Labedaea rhizosphaerae]